MQKNTLRMELSFLKFLSWSLVIAPVDGILDMNGEGYRQLCEIQGCNDVSWLCWMLKAMQGEKGGFTWFYLQDKEIASS